MAPAKMPALLVESNEAEPASERSCIVAGDGASPFAVLGSKQRPAARRGLAKVTQKLKSIFLPEGYPESVSQEYLQYQIWDTVQALCSYLRGVLATQALLQGVGVGDEGATPLAAALQWLLRDGAGMLGQLAFAALAAPFFSVNLKSWRLFADLINNVGLTLDLLAPLAGNDRFLLVASAAQVCKAMCGVAAGATKAALTAHFALKDNMADVQAKEGSQETFVTLLGLVFGMRFAAYANNSPSTIWLAFIALTALHCVANYRGVRCLRLPGLNPARMDLLVEAWLAKEEEMTVACINGREEALMPLLRPACTWLCCLLGKGQRLPRVHMGARLADVGLRTREELDRLLGAVGKENGWGFTVCRHKGDAFVIFEEGVAQRQQVLAYFEGRAYASRGEAGEVRDAFSVMEAQQAKAIRAEAQKFLSLAESLGWKVDGGVAGTGSWRYSADTGNIGKVD